MMNGYDEIILLAKFYVKRMSTWHHDSAEFHTSYYDFMCLGITGSSRKFS